MSIRLVPYLISALLALSAGACREDTATVPPPQEFTRDSIAMYCSMSLKEHAGPKAQIFLKSVAGPQWFASVHDAFAYTMLLEEPKDITAIYVNDMGKAKNWDQPEPATWIEAHSAIFVIESARRGGMDEDEAVPFSDQTAAAEFMKQHGGRPVSFAQMPKSYILSASNAETAGQVREATP